MQKNDNIKENSSINSSHSFQEIIPSHPPHSSSHRLPSSESNLSSIHEIHQVKNTSSNKNQTEINVLEVLSANNQKKNSSVDNSSPKKVFKSLRAQDSIFSRPSNSRDNELDSTPVPGPEPLINNQQKLNSTEKKIDNSADDKSGSSKVNLTAKNSLHSIVSQQNSDIGAGTEDSREKINRKISKDNYSNIVENEEFQFGTPGNLPDLDQLEIKTPKPLKKNSILSTLSASIQSLSEKNILVKQNSLNYSQTDFSELYATPKMTRDKDQKEKEHKDGSKKVGGILKTIIHNKQSLKQLAQRENQHAQQQSAGESSYVDYDNSMDLAELSRSKENNHNSGYNLPQRKGSTKLQRTFPLISSSSKSNKHSLSVRNSHLKLNDKIENDNNRAYSRSNDDDLDPNDPDHEMNTSFISQSNSKLTKIKEINLPGIAILGESPASNLFVDGLKVCNFPIIFNKCNLITYNTETSSQIDALLLDNNIEIIVISTDCPSQTTNLVLKTLGIGKNVILQAPFQGAFLAAFACGHSLFVFLRHAQPTYEIATKNKNTHATQ